MTSIFTIISLWSLFSCGDDSSPGLENTKFLAYSIMVHQEGQTELLSETRQINVTISFDADITKLTASFGLSPDATAFIGNVQQESGVTVNDFSAPITYRVESADGASSDWLVTITQMDKPDFIVTTLVKDFPGNDGVSVDKDGYIYVNSNGKLNQWNGTTIYKVSPDGSEVSQFAAGLPSWPVGSQLDRDGNLYVTGWNAPRIVTKILQDGTTQKIASGIQEASGLEIDNDGNFYVMEPPTNSMIKITPDGQKSVFAQGGSFNKASGITYDRGGGTFYVSNWFDGNISHVAADGTVSLFTTLPVRNLGPIFISRNFLYVSNPNGNKIYRVDKNTKEFILLAGTGARGNVDGFANQASFSFPLGVGISPDGKHVYVAEVSPSGNGRLRVISPAE